MQDMQEEAPAVDPDEAVTTSTTDQPSPDESHGSAHDEAPEIASVAPMEQGEQPAPALKDEAAPETVPLRAMETKPLPALESTGQAATANTPDAAPDDAAYAASEPMAEPDSSSDDDSRRGP